MAVTLTTLESNLQTKLNNTSGTTDAQEFLLLSKSVEALNPSIAVQDVIDEGTTQVGLVQTAGATQIAAVQAAGSGYATQADIDASVSALVDTAPATLDTLNELAAALGDDANFSTTVTNSIATKLPLAGGTMTGDVTYNDNVKAQFGTGSDLQIYHDNTNSYVKEEGTGELRLGSNNAVRLTKHDSETLAVFSADGAVDLYYDNAKKFETTPTGVNVEGIAVTDGVTVDGTLDIEEVIEKAALDTSTTGLFQAELKERAVVFLTANQTANRQINFRGDGSNSLNSMLASGQSITMSVLSTQGSAAYYFNSYTVDGTAVTPKWSGGSAPTAGNASGIDVYTFTIIKTADATFTVLASQTQYA